MAESNVSLPGFSRRVLVASKQFPRFSEADVAGLKDGRLLLAVARKEGAGDFATGTIVGMYSGDGGLSWDDAVHVIQGPWGDVVDVMSVSLFRTGRGVHLLFLGRGKDAKRDTRVYQMISADEGVTWGEPVRVSTRGGYHVVNNARLIRTAKGRLIVPVAWTPDIGKQYEGQRTVCYYSDDDGVTWRESNEVVLEGKALMEPGVAECADGSVYMTIRTALGFLYEARSRDGGATWGEFGATKLPSPAAPSTVVREPGGGDDLWMFWCDNAKGNWKGRNRIVFAASADHGKTWGTSRVVEADPKGSFGYTSVTAVGRQVLLTYYDWRDRGQAGFADTSLRLRMIPRAWFEGEVVPPVFRTSAEPVLRADRAGEGKILSMNSGLLVEGGRWRLWYTNGALGPEGERLRVGYAESKDAGRTWEKSGAALLSEGPGNLYHASAHRDGGRVVLFVWRNAPAVGSGLWRYVSADDGKTFVAEPARPIVAHWNAKAEVKARAGAGRESNDAFDVVRGADGAWHYYAATVEKAEDPRAVVKHDNAAGWVRVIGHAGSRDGVAWSPVQVVIEPDYANGDPWDEQFYGMQVFRHRGFWLGILCTYRAGSQVIVPEWAWSHNGVNWTRTRTPCVSLGDEGRFDSRMIVFGRVVVTEGEVVWLYSGYDWRHNGYRKGEVGSAVGRAVMGRGEFDRWLDSLERP